MQQSHNLGINLTVTDNASAQLTQFQNKIQQVNSQLQRFNANMNQMQTTSSTGMNTASKEIDKTSKNMNNLNNETTKTTKQQQKLRKSTDNAGKSVSGFRQEQEAAIATNKNWLSGYSESIGIALRSVAIWGVATTAIYGTKRALEEMHQIMVDVDSEMVSLRRVMNSAVTDFEELRSSAAGLGVSFATSIDEVVQSMVGWARQGQEQIEVIQLTEAALLASNVAQMEAARSVDLLTAAILQFNMDASFAVEVVDRWNEVANNFAVTAEDLATSVREAGAAADSAGVSMDELVGITASLSAATAKSGSRIGRTLRTMFSRMMGDANDGGEALGKVELALNRVGVSLRESETEYRNMTDVITDLAVQWDDLDGVMKANIARAMGGRRRYSDVISLLNNWDMALEATETSMGSLNSAIEENETYMESLEATWQVVTNQFQEFALIIADLGMEELSRQFAGMASAAITTIRDITVGLTLLEEQGQFVTAGIVAFATYMGGKFVAQLGLAKAAITGITTVLAANPYILGIAALTTTVLTLSKAIGEKNRQLEIAADNQADLNAITERGNELSQTEINNISGTIEGLKELSEQYITAGNQLEDFNVLQEAFFAVTDLFGTPIDLTFGLSPDKQVYEELNRIQEETILELKMTFPDLNEEFDNDVEFLTAVNKELDKYGENLEKTTGWIARNGTALADNTRQGMREVKMLESRVERLTELDNINNKTLEQDLERQEIIRDLQNEYYELADTENIATEANRILQEEMSKYTKGSENMIEVTSTLEQRILQLQENEEGLRRTKKNLARDIAETDKKFQESVETLGRHHPETVAILNNLDKMKSRYESLGDQLVLSKETQIELTQSLNELNRGISDVDVDLLLTHFQEAKKVLIEFGDEIRDIQIELQDYKDFLEKELEGVAWEADIRGLEDFEKLELEADVVDSYVDSLIDMGYALFEIEAALGSARTIEDVRLILEGIDEDALETAGINPERVIQDWEEDFANAEGMDVSTFIENLLNDIKTEATNQFERAEALSTEQLFENLLDRTDDGDLSELYNLTESELNDALNQIEKLIETDDELQLYLPLSRIFNLRGNIETEQAQRTIIEQLSDVHGNIQGMTDFEIDLLNLEEGMTSSEQIDIITESILSLGDSARTFEDTNLISNLNDLNNFDFSTMSTDEVEDLLSVLEQRSSTLEELPESLEELNNIEGLDSGQKTQLIELINLMEDYDLTLEEAINRAEKEIRIRDISSQVREKELSLLGEYERNIVNLTEEITKFSEIQEEISDEDLINRIDRINEKLESQRRVYEAVIKLQDLGFEGFDIDASDMGINEVLNMGEAIESKYKGLDKDIDSIAQNIGLTGEELEEALNKAELDKESYEEALNELEERLNTIAENWASNFQNGVQNGLNALDEMEDVGLGKAFGTVIASGLIEVLSDEETFVATFETLDKLLGQKTGDWSEIVKNPIMKGIQAGVSSIASGSSVGRGALTGIGQAVGGTVGAAIGDAIGAVGEWFFAPDEEMLQMVEDVEKVNEGIKEANSSLQDYNVSLDYTTASTRETTGLIEGFFGGESWDISGLEAAEGSLENMQSVLQRLESRANQLGNDLSNSVQNSFNYRDMYQSFRQSVGEAMIQATLDAMIESQVMQEHFDLLSGQIENAISDGYLADDELGNIEGTIDYITQQAEQARPLLQQIQEMMGIDVDARQQRTFRAGATSSITYHNSFIVQAQSFNGNESDARQFAKLIAPYVRKEIGVKSGN